MIFRIDRGSGLSHEQENYNARVYLLSHRLVNAQAALRLLDAIRWDDAIRLHFFASNYQQQPQVGADYYTRRALKFDPAVKMAEFRSIASDAMQMLGTQDPMALWIMHLCEQYQLMVAMIEARGSRAFSVLCSELYGAAGDAIPGTSKSTAMLAMELLPMVRGAIADHNIKNNNSTRHDIDVRRHDAQAAAKELQRRLAPVFGNDRIKLQVSDKLIADAAAGSDYIKLRAAAKYSDRDIGVLEVHEGWVHIGTALNGQAQPCCTFLGKTAPAASSTQEGLAVLTEIIAGKSSPLRVYKLLQRAVAIHLVEDGANFIEVFRYFTNLGDSAESIYQLCMRVFRGSAPTAGAFTKDIGYLRGLVQVTAFVRECLASNDWARLNLLFCGKCAVEDISLITQLAQDGVIKMPDFIVPAFTDRAALTQSMAALTIAPGLELAAYL